MKELSVREIRREDFEPIITYWENMSDSDIARMHLVRESLPTRKSLLAFYDKNCALPLQEQPADTFTWLIDGKVAGLANLDTIVRGEQANIHLHMFDTENRGKGYGRKLFTMALLKYFERHPLKRIYCEPAADNPHPNGLLHAIGAPLVKTYFNEKPAFICVPHTVNRYEFEREKAREIAARVLGQE